MYITNDTFEITQKQFLKFYIEIVFTFLKVTTTFNACV